MNDVLIVEDEPGVRMFFDQALKRMTIPCRMATNGIKALQLARENWPAIVLLDLTLPGRLDGWQVWDGLDDLARGRPLRVIVCAAEIDSLVRAQSAQRGAAGLLRKPVLLDDLAVAISQALRLA